MFAMVSFQGYLNVEKFAIEDELEMAFEGIGEVCGAGVGQTGCHLDLNVNDSVPVDEVLSRITRVLTDLQVTTEGKIVINSQVFMYRPSGPATGEQANAPSS
jgi:hypothetical protein